MLWVGYASPEPVLDDEMSDQIVAGNYSGRRSRQLGYYTYLANLGYDGSGVHWAHHRHRRRLRPPRPGTEHRRRLQLPRHLRRARPARLPGGGHGTHVTGIIGGDAATRGFTDPNGFLYGLGIAPGYEHLRA